MSDWTDIYEYDGADVHGNMTDWVNSSNPGTKLEKGFFDDHSGKSIAAILDVLRGSTTDSTHNVVWAHEYSHLDTAYNDLNSGGTLILVPGTYDLSGSPVVVDQDNTSIIALGHGAVITNTGSNCDGFQITADYVRMQNLKLTGGGSHKIDYGIKMTGAKFAFISDLYLHDTYKSALRLEGTGSDYTKENTFRTIYTDNCGQNATDPSVTLSNHSDNNDFYRLYVNAGHSATHGDLYVVESDGCNFVSCLASAAAYCGVEVTTNTYSFHWIGGGVGAAQRYGMLFYQVKHALVQSALIHWNGQAAADTYSNIRMDQADHVHIDNCLIYGTKEPDDGLTQYSKYGIEVVNAQCRRCSLTNNDVFDNVTANILDNGTGTRTHNNEEIYP